jgi:magnesium-transporting ATPase (P-type)
LYKNLGKNFVEKLWKDAIVGDLIRIEEMDLIPADIVVLCSSSPTGECYIETSSLDGEKNLKPKMALMETNSSASNLDLLNSASDLVCMPPNSLLHSFEGTLIWGDRKLYLTVKQFLLRGARLKNTKWVVGIVAYAGPETKIMRNAEPAKNKASIIERKTNKFIIFIFLVQVVICIICSLGSFIWAYLYQNNHKYLPHDEKIGLTSFLTFFTYFLLLNTMIPISLVVSLEFVKLTQAYFMAEDDHMYTKENNRRLKVFSSSLNEELGQIEYIFTDKTGTLTCNRMEFKYAAIGDEIYGGKDYDQNDFNVDGTHKRVYQRRPTYTDINGGIAFSFYDERLDSLLRGDERPSTVDIEMRDEKEGGLLLKLRNQTDLIFEYLLALATCHECIVDVDKNGVLNYQVTFHQNNLFYFFSIFECFFPKREGVKQNIQ